MAKKDIIDTQKDDDIEINNLGKIGHFKKADDNSEIVTEQKRLKKFEETKLSNEKDIILDSNTNVKINFEKFQQKTKIYKFKNINNRIEKILNKPKLLLIT
jgi:tRNA 2-selenouridine synthase SelU